MEPQVNINCRRRENRNCCVDLILVILITILAFVIGLLVGALTGILVLLNLGAIIVLITILAIMILTRIIILIKIKTHKFMSFNFTY